MEYLKFWDVPWREGMRFQYINIQKNINTVTNVTIDDSGKILKVEYLKDNGEKQEAINKKDFRVHSVRIITELINKGNERNVLDIVGIEGNPIMKTHLSYERDKNFAKKFKDKYKCISECPSCKENHKHKYGIEPISFYDLHHLISLSKIKTEHKVKEKDVILLCPNCHRAIHKLMANPVNFNKLIGLKELIESFPQGI